MTFGAFLDRFVPSIVTDYRVSRRRRTAQEPGGAWAVRGRCVEPVAQWKESPHAHEPVALGLSIVKPCFSIVSTKSMLAPLR